MRIGLMHFRVGENDGVSLEMDKCKTVLEKMGHEVLYIAGELNGLPGIRIPSISMKNETNQWIHSNAFENLSISEEKFIKLFEDYVSRIYEELRNSLPEIEMLIVHNILSLGFNLAAAVAITKYAMDRNIKLLCHHHDFYWEREKYSKPQTTYVRELLDKYFPPKEANIFHITINKLSRDELKLRKSVDSIVIPNVFDFEQRDWVIDDYNKDLRKTLGIDGREIVILHATRIVERKAIEIAMDFVEEFAKIAGHTVHFVLAGFPEPESMGYYEKLKRKSEKMSFRTYFAHDMIKYKRHVDENGRKFYSLWDFYAIADAITYTSVLEGWGNQLIEAVFARKPLVIYEYPVYKSDIAPLGFKFISLSDKAVYNQEEQLYETDVDILRERASELKKLLSNPNHLHKIVQHNFEIGKEFLSLKSLQRHFEKVFRLCDT